MLFFDGLGLQNNTFICSCSNIRTHCDPPVKKFAYPSQSDLLKSGWCLRVIVVNHLKKSFISNAITEISGKPTDMNCCTFCFYCILLLTYSIFYLLRCLHFLVLSFSFLSSRVLVSHRIFSIQDTFYYMADFATVCLVMLNKIQTTVASQPITWKLMKIFRK